MILEVVGGNHPACADGDAHNWITGEVVKVNENTVEIRTVGCRTCGYSVDLDEPLEVRKGEVEREP